MKCCVIIENLRAHGSIEGENIKKIRISRTRGHDLSTNEATVVNLPSRLWLVLRTFFSNSFVLQPVFLRNCQWGKMLNMCKKRKFLIFWFVAPGNISKKKQRATFPQWGKKCIFWYKVLKVAVELNGGSKYKYLNLGARCGCARVVHWLSR